jgi:transketolase
LTTPRPGVSRPLLSDADDLAGVADPDRDRFILSKGHAALALYAVLHLGGLVDAAQLDTFCADGTVLGVHPEHTLPGVDFSTGSLGHGLSIGAGAALAARLHGSKRRAFVLMSDAELNEGSVWEAAMFAAHHRLDQLIAVVDCNGQQAFGHTRDVLDLEPIADRWRAFGWDVKETPGHDIGRLVDALDAPDTSGRPRLVIARTVFGRGVSYMERQIKWHYMPMSEEEYQTALRDVRAGSGTRA